MTPDTLYTIVLLFEGDMMRGDWRILLGVMFCTVTLRYDEVALRSVQNIPDMIGTGRGRVTFENPEFER